MDTNEITQKSAKKDIWEAYQAILQEIKDKKVEGAEVQPPLKFEDESVLANIADLDVVRAVNEIGELKINTINLLNKLSDRLSEELKRLESVNKAIEIKNKQLADNYRIETEAIGLLDLITANEQKKAEFQKESEAEEEKMKAEIQQKKKEQEREIEEYQYQLKFDRKKEDDDYEFRQQIREREFNEKLVVKERESAAREIEIKKQESEIQSLKARVDAVPEEIEKAKKESAGQTKLEMEKQFKIEREIAQIEQEKEKEVAKLKVAGLEDMVKRQAAQIHALESQLAITNQKAQELAVKIIESGGFEKEEQREYHEE